LGETGRRRLLASGNVTNLRLASAEPSALDVDAIVIGVVATDSGPRPAPGADDIDRALDGRLTATLEALGAKGKAEEITKIPTLGSLPAPLIVAVGLGPVAAGGPAPEALRRAAGAATRALAGSAKVAVMLPGTTAAETDAVALGTLLGNYAFARYQTGADGDGPIESVTVVTSGAGGDEAARRATAVADAVALTRDLVNTPPSDLPPKEFAEAAELVAKDSGLEIEVLDERALRDGGYGGIVGVGQGSVNPPRLIRLAYQHPEATRTIAYVGKGITFDSGGLSLKPADSMVTMKADMAGAAAVLSALKAIAALRPVVNVVGYLALAENMPSGTAQRPSDVLTIYGGKTVEVLNTDAEGRLVLADGIVRAGEDDPELIVDVATLTGAQVVALGARTSGVMANSDELRDQVAGAARRAGETMWPMPLPDELRKGLDSAVADLANISGDRWGGMLTAAVFLKEFVPEGVRWAHLDIAGPAFNEREPYGYTPKGGTGVATRTLVQIAEDIAAGSL
jgi:leucyl aminopeptidase